MANNTTVTALVFASYQRDTENVRLGVFVVKREQQTEVGEAVMSSCAMVNIL